MRIELLLQIAMAALTALGTLLLGMGERQMLLPLIAVMVSASSVYLTDMSGWLRLNPRVANIAGSSAVVIFVWDFLQRFDEQTQLLAVANLLIYLQFVLLYQKKTDSTYWLLALLSLLQVAVATALNFELIFGLLLLLYLACGLTALGLFFLHRELNRFAHRAARRAPAAESTTGNRWPLRLTGAINVVWRHSEPREALGWRFLRQMMGLAAATLGTGLCFFFVVPRLGQSTWQSPVATAQNVVGASNEVALDEFGPIHENPEVVMRIELYQGNSYRDYVLKETPLFRGPVLTEYTRNKTWRQAGEIHLPVNPPKPPRDADGLVRQVIRMRPSNTNSVFCVAPVVGVPEAADKQLHYNPHTEQLTRSQLGRDQTIEVYTSGFVGGRQLLFIPNNISAHNLAPLTALPSGELPRLINLAQVLVAHLAPDQGLERVRALTNHLHDSGLYQYSLTTPRRNPTIDPVEDFLFEHQSGHCEYFASALALMLRAIDIPARVVLGFNGGEYNVMGGFYQVRQLHAHAWVEAYLPRDQLPPQLRRDSAWKHGGWITLDPTPGSSGAISRIGATAGVPTFRQVADYARYLWSSYIMGLDSDRQLRTIYEPVALWLVRSGKKLLDPAAWRFLVHLLVRALGIDTPWVAPLAGTIALAALLAAGLLGLQHARFSRLANLLAPFRFGRVKSSAPTATVDFYRRLELILARFGILGGSSLTQYEFAVLARGQLIDRGLSAVASAPLAVAEAFYRVRFGCRQLDKREVEAVEQALTNLNEAAERVSAPAHG